MSENAWIVLVLLSATMGLVVGLSVDKLVRRTGPVTTATILERGQDGVTRLIQAEGVNSWPAHTGPPLRPYDVGPDGVIEYADGERVDPDATIIKPPDMRLID